MDEITVYENTEKNGMNNSKKNGVTKKCGADLVSNLYNFIFQHKRRKIKESRQYIEAVQKGIDYMKEYYAHPITLQKIKTQLGEAYDIYGKNLAVKGISKEEYITKTMSNVCEGLKNIQCYFVNKESLRVHTEDKLKFKNNSLKSNIVGFFSSGETNYCYVLNKRKVRGLRSVYGNFFIQSESVHEIDHYVQYLLFNFSEKFSIVEINKIYDGEMYDERRVNPLYLHLQKQIQGLFGNRKTIYEQILEKEFEQNSKDTHYEINLLEILSRIRQLKLARLHSLDEKLDMESIKDYEFISNADKYEYSGEILSQIVDKQKFLDFANTIW